MAVIWSCRILNQIFHYISYLCYNSFKSHWFSPPVIVNIILLLFFYKIERLFQSIETQIAKANIFDLGLLFGEGDSHVKCQGKWRQLPEMS